MKKSMKKIIVIFLMLVYLAGCSTTLPQIRSGNRERLRKLSLGMTKQKVLHIMGTETINAHSRSGEVIGVIDNPYKRKILRGKEMTFEVLYYYTRIRHSDGAITDDELTPIVFYEGKLIGVGWPFFIDLGKRYGIKGKPE